MPNRVGMWLIIGLLSLLGIEMALGVRGDEPTVQRTRPTTSWDVGGATAFDGGDGIPTPKP